MTRNMPLQILLNGAKGRMGEAIIAVAESEDARIIAAVDMGDDPLPGLRQAAVAIDFSFHSATVPLLEVARSCKCPVVIGTTGHSEEERQQIIEISKDIPVVWAGNYSVGVNLLFYLVEKAAGILGDNYHPEVVEMHHRHKKDAPSGTAEGFVEAILAGRQWGRDAVRNGREGITGERPDVEVGVHALRGGDVVGDHTVIFAGPGERVEISHRAADRAIFARGAVRAAHWVQGKPPGRYSMRDVLGLSD